MSWSPRRALEILATAALVVMLLAPVPAAGEERKDAAEAPTSESELVRTVSPAMTPVPKAGAELSLSSSDDPCESPNACLLQICDACCGQWGFGYGICVYPLCLCW